MGYLNLENIRNIRKTLENRKIFAQLHSAPCDN